MVPDRQKIADGRTDGMTDDAKTISLRLHRGDNNQTFASAECSRDA